MCMASALIALFSIIRLVDSTRLQAKAVVAIPACYIGQDRGPQISRALLTCVVTPAAD